MIAAISEDYGLLFHTDQTWLVIESGCSVCSEEIYLNGKIACDAFDCDFGSLNTTCRLVTMRSLQADLLMKGNGSILIEKGGALMCSKAQCSIELNMWQNVSIEGFVSAMDIMLESQNIIITGTVNVSGKAQIGLVNGSGGRDCCEGQCTTSNPFKGGGGGGHGGAGGGCCHNALGGGAHSDGISSPWSVGGGGGRGFATGSWPRLITSGFCSGTTGLAHFPDEAACRAASAQYFMPSSPSWGGSLCRYGNPYGCFVSGSTVYFNQCNYGLQCSAAQMCLCQATPSGSSVMVSGGKGGGRIKLAARNELRIDGLVAADGGDGDNCSSQHSDLAVSRLSAGACPSAGRIADEQTCRVAALKLGAGFGYQGTASRYPEAPEGCFVVGSSVFWNPSARPDAVASGDCGARQITDAGVCSRYASAWYYWGGTQYTSSYPGGCVLIGPYVYFNAYVGTPSVSCSTTQQCLCQPAKACSASYSCLCGRQEATCGAGGGGAGGSIQLEAAMVSGAGTVRANGGSGGFKNGVYLPSVPFSSGGGGSGGGGRISVSSQVFSSFISFSAMGGRISDGCPDAGVAGSIFFNTSGFCRLKVGGSESGSSGRSVFECVKHRFVADFELGANSVLEVAGPCRFENIVLEKGATMLSRSPLVLQIAGRLDIAEGAAIEARSSAAIRTGAGITLGVQSTIISGSQLNLSTAGSMVVSRRARLVSGENMTIFAASNLTMKSGSLLKSGAAMSFVVEANATCEEDGLVSSGGRMDMTVKSDIRMGPSCSIRGNDSLAISAGGSAIASAGCEVAGGGAIRLSAGRSVVSCSMHAPEIIVKAGTSVAVPKAAEMQARQTKRNASGQAGRDCCNAPCSFLTSYAGGGGGANGGSGGGCCHNGRGQAFAAPGSMSRPWAFGGQGGGGVVADVIVALQSTCSSAGATQISDEAACRAAAAQYFMPSSPSWGGSPCGYSPYGCVVSGSTVYFNQCNYGLQCSAAQMCLCKATPSGSSVMVSGGKGGGRIKLAARNELRIDGLVAADGGDGDNCSSQHSDLAVSRLSAGACPSAGRIADEQTCRVAALKLGAGFGYQGTASRYPEAPEGCFVVGSSVFWNPSARPDAVASGDCGARQITDAGVCSRYASAWYYWGGTQYTSSYPGGCVLIGPYVYFNAYVGTPSVSCSTTQQCICQPAKACSASYSCLCGRQAATCGAGGGGAGGSIQLEAAVVSGAGTVRANGGSGGFSHLVARGSRIDPSGGSGGGGRISAVYDSLEPSVTFESRSGRRSGGGGCEGVGGTVLSFGRAQRVLDLMVSQRLTSCDDAGESARLSAQSVEAAIFDRPISLRVQKGIKLHLDGTFLFDMLELGDCSQIIAGPSLNATKIVMNANSSIRSESSLIVNVARMFVACSISAAVDVEVTVGDYFYVLSGGNCSIKSGASIRMSANQFVYLSFDSKLTSKLNFVVNTKDFFGCNVHVAKNMSLSASGVATLLGCVSTIGGDMKVYAKRANLLQGTDVSARSQLFLVRSLAMSNQSVARANEEIRVRVDGDARVCSLVSGGGLLLNVTGSALLDSACSVESSGGDIRAYVGGRFSSSPGGVILSHRNVLLACWSARLSGSSIRAHGISISARADFDVLGDLKRNPSVPPPGLQSSLTAHHSLNISAARLTLRAARVACTSHACSTRIAVAADLLFQGAALAASVVEVSAAWVAVDVSSVISSVGRGFAAAEGPGAGRSFCGGRLDMAWQGGGGAGHGGTGAGCCFDGGGGGPLYGAGARVPWTAGSGGGAGHGSVSGGAGGGRIRIQASQVIVDGRVDAGGMRGAGTATGGSDAEDGSRAAGGGGAGGSIIIAAWSLEGQGVVCADGGLSGEAANGDFVLASLKSGGAGAGGYVTVLGSGRSLQDEIHGPVVRAAGAAATDGCQGSPALDGIVAFLNVSHLGQPGYALPEWSGGQAWHESGNNPFSHNWTKGTAWAASLPLPMGVTRWPDVTASMGRDSFASQLALNVPTRVPSTSMQTGISDSSDSVTYPSSARPSTAIPSALSAEATTSVPLPAISQVTSSLFLPSQVRRTVSVSEFASSTVIAPLPALAATSQANLQPVVNLTSYPSAGLQASQPSSAPVLSMTASYVADSTASFANVVLGYIPSVNSSTARVTGRTEAGFSQRWSNGTYGTSGLSKMNQLETGRALSSTASPKLQSSAPALTSSSFMDQNVAGLQMNSATLQNKTALQRFSEMPLLSEAIVTQAHTRGPTSTPAVTTGPNGSTRILQLTATLPLALAAFVPHHDNFLKGVAATAGVPFSDVAILAMREVSSRSLSKPAPREPVNLNTSIFTRGLQRRLLAAVLEVDVKIFFKSVSASSIAGASFTGGSGSNTNVEINVTAGKIAAASKALMDLGILNSNLAANGLPAAVTRVSLHDPVQLVQPAGAASATAAEKASKFQTAAVAVFIIVIFVAGFVYAWRRALSLKSATSHQPLEEEEA